jgi:hypothetical protein
MERVSRNAGARINYEESEDEDQIVMEEDDYSDEDEALLNDLDGLNVDESIPSDKPTSSKSDAKIMTKQQLLKEKLKALKNLVPFDLPLTADHTYYGASDPKVMIEAKRKSKAKTKKPSRKGKETVRVQGPI